mgnify:CR=1 FL=1
MDDHPALSISKLLAIASIVSKVFSTAASCKKNASISPSPSLKKSVMVWCSCLARSVRIFVIGSEQSTLVYLSMITGTKEVM